mmetsp:Transcript_5734/g.8463  ORF Transcript_5734/g.8463 Transcript_5734/m.8463 type:complete len:529 (+) Transcript_5734:43-1629(+)
MDLAALLGSAAAGFFAIGYAVGGMSCRCPGGVVREENCMNLRFWKEGEDSKQIETIVRKVVPSVQKKLIKVSVVSGGITNKLFRVEIVGHPTLLVRIFGAEGMIDRNIENKTYKWLASENIAPKYFGRFANGRIEKFHDGFIPLSLDDMKDAKISQSIATSLARLHKLEIPGDMKKIHPTVGLWSQIKTWLIQAKAQRTTIPSNLITVSPLSSPIATPSTSPYPSPKPLSRSLDGTALRKQIIPSDKKVSAGEETPLLKKKINVVPAVEETKAHSPRNPLKMNNEGDSLRQNDKTKSSSSKCKLSKISIAQYISIDLNRCALAINGIRHSIEPLRKRGSSGGDVAITEGMRKQMGELKSSVANGREEKSTENAKMSRIVFCHNDLLCGNILRRKGGSEVKLIDFEYGGLGYRGFDIANHFNEWAGGTLESKEGGPGYNGWPDYSRFPSDSQQRSFCISYLREYLGRNPTSKDVDELMNEVREFVTLNHFYWGLWAVNRAFEEGCEDFDYMHYATQRIMQGLMDGQDAC